MKEEEMEQIGKWIAKVAKEFAVNELPDDKKARPKAVKAFEKDLAKSKLVARIKEEVKNFATKFPVPGID
ncbi:MAG: hypothetical protein IID16_08075 [Candidatus Marinimicrobia bacterium]|nr:hypothetical protein [Candidatus Neomarinimicrobiota bacterium]